MHKAPGLAVAVIVTVQSMDGWTFSGLAVAIIVTVQSMGLAVAIIVTVQSNA